MQTHPRGKEGAEAAQQPENDPWLTLDAAVRENAAAAEASGPRSGGTMPIPAPPAAPAPPPPGAGRADPGAARPSLLRRIAGVLRARAKLLVFLVLVGSVYGGYRVFEYYQPYEWSGSVEARTVTVGSRTGGRVKDVLVKEGDEVKAGTVLITLEPGDLLSKKAEAEGDVEVAEATLEKLANGARHEEVAQAAARLAGARALAAKESQRAALESKEASRAKTLFTTGAISTAESEVKVGAARAAAASAVEASARAKDAEASLKLLTGGTRPEDLRIARANLEVARAKLAGINAQLEELTIRAPRDVRIESITVRPGDILPNDAAAATLLEKGQLYVRIFVPETQLGRVRTGETVPITVDSYPNRVFHGRIEHVNEVGEFTPRRLSTTEDRASEVFAARVSLLDGDRELRAGMAAFVHASKR